MERTQNSTSILVSAVNERLMSQAGRKAYYKGAIAHSRRVSNVWRTSLPIDRNWNSQRHLSLQRGFVIACDKVEI